MFDWIQHDVLGQLETAIQVLIAAVLGGAVGFEREAADRPAGLRTHSLLCGAAALLTLLTEGLVLELWEDTGASVIRADPVRMVEAIVLGVSFIGAGTIFRSSDSVRGLTTGASLLMVAGVGIAVALGELYLAVTVTVLSLVLLRAMKRYLEPRVVEKVAEQDPPGGER